MDKDTFEQGLTIRKEVLSAEHVERALAGADDFNRPYQELVTEYCWGAVWGRPGLSRKTRSLLNRAMLTAFQTARARGVPQRRHQGGDPRGSASGHDLLRCARRQLRVQAGARGIRPDGTRGDSCLIRTSTTDTETPAANASTNRYREEMDREDHQA
jgi:Carboxymuconolactone decarboxylase family